jgi:hypothetical protein
MKTNTALTQKVTFTNIKNAQVDFLSLPPSDRADLCLYDTREKEKSNKVRTEDM